MSAEAIYRDRDFYAPRFVLRIDGRDIPFHTVRDVIDVTFEDSLDALEYFEFTLHDWDWARNAPKYSSPWDAAGAAQRDGEGHAIPAFEPGTYCELQLGYYGPEEPVTKLVGTIVSIAPSFPDSGVPQMKVRVLSDFFKLQNTQVTRAFADRTDTQIAQALAQDIGIGVATPAGQSAAETPNEYLMLANEYPINFLLRRARLLGYDIAVLPMPDQTAGLDITGGGGDSVLFFGAGDTAQPSFALQWGATLASFDVAVRIRDQVGKVMLRSTNPALAGAQRDIVAEAGLADLDLDFPDPKLRDTVTGALATAEEVVVDEPVQNQAEADARALGILRERAKDLVTAQGATVGFPHFRAGNTVEIGGVGVRYSGRWLLTKTTHRIDASGYTTRFAARLLGRAA